VVNRKLNRLNILAISVGENYCSRHDLTNAVKAVLEATEIQHEDGVL
jgi:hypothetical protein